MDISLKSWNLPWLWLKRVVINTAAVSFVIGLLIWGVMRKSLEPEASAIQPALEMAMLPLGETVLIRVNVGFRRQDGLNINQS